MSETEHLGPAATVLLLRDGPAGLEVFMVQRSEKASRFEGALVFPGGKVDPADADAALIPRCTGGKALSDAERALRVGAIRETFEECGVLLARPRGAPDLLDAARAEEIEQRHRKAVHCDECSMGDVAEAEDLDLALDLLLPFANWITPRHHKRRFDVHFFACAKPPGEIARHDGIEAVASRWTTPEAVIADCRAERCRLVMPTFANLSRLGAFASVDAVLGHARATPVMPVCAEYGEDEDGDPVVMIPRAAGYTLDQTPLGLTTGSRKVVLV